MAVQNFLSGKKLLTAYGFHINFKFQSQKSLQGPADDAVSDLSVGMALAQACLGLDPI